MLNSNYTYVSFPLLSLGSSTVRSNHYKAPLPMQDKYIKLAKQTQISEKKYKAISNHAYKRSKKTQITFLDKNIDLIINS